jgi:hypothetical protein
LETCRQCRQPTYCDTCGTCVRHGVPKVRRAPTRQWLVSAKWLLKMNGRWTPWAVAKVTARGPLGALNLAYYDLRKERPKRVHIIRTDYQVVPVPRRKRGLSWVAH